MRNLERFNVQKLSSDEQVELWHSNNYSVDRYWNPKLKRSIAYLDLDDENLDQKNTAFFFWKSARAFYVIQNSPILYNIVKLFATIPAIPQYTDMAAKDSRDGTDVVPHENGLPDEENRDPLHTHNLRKRNRRKNGASDAPPKKKRRSTTKAPPVPVEENGQEDDNERLWALYEELQALRYTAPERQLIKYKQLVQEELQAAESLAVQYKEEYERLKMILEKKNMKNVLDDAKELKRENDELKLKLLQASSDAVVRNGGGHEGVDETAAKEKRDSMVTLNRAQDDVKAGHTCVQEIILKLLGAECVPISDDGQEGFLCTLKNEKKNTHLKFNLFVEEDGFDYEPVSIEVGSSQIPVYMRDAISFDFVQAPTFLNKLLTILYT